LMFSNIIFFTICSVVRFRSLAFLIHTRDKNTAY